MNIQSQKVSVWDPFVRVFHWSLVLAYLGAWASAEEWAGLHDQLGYFILVLVGLRLIWGLVGTRYARFSSFLRAPRTAMAYLRSLAGGRPTHYVGHNPIGGWMVIALMACLTATGVTGILMGAEDGPWEELHEIAANLSLLLVAVHVGGVLVASLLHEENLIGAMLTGDKLRRNPDV